MTIEGQACIITGAGRGIGQAIALRLARAGFSVLATARTTREIEETARQAVGLPGRCIPHTADVTRSQDVDGLVTRCLDAFGRLDVLVNNAGLAPMSSIEETTDTMLREVLAVNVEAVVYTCRAAWSALKATRGTIINLSSVAAVDPFAQFAIYGGAKAFVNTFTRALAAEGKPLGIKVFALGPGAVETQMLRKVLPDLPVEKCLPPEEIAGAVEWLLDPRCEQMSGQTYYITR